MNAKDRLKDFLETLYDRYNDSEYACTDPIVFPHTLEGDREYIAHTAACFAYGNVKAIQKFLAEFFKKAGGTATPEPNVDGLYYRFQKEEDIRAYVKAYAEMKVEFGSMEQAFLSFSNDLDTALIEFSLHMKKLGEKHGAGDGYKFLFPDPVKSGAKRHRMFLRWMIRKDEIDFGLWKGYDKKELKFPIDTHILRYAANNGVIKNTAGTKKNLETVTGFFREICLEDPARYDFALSRLGIVNNCIYSKTDKCDDCILRDKCAFI